MNKLIYAFLIASIAMISSCNKAMIEDETPEMLYEEAIDELLTLSSNAKTSTLLEDQTKSGTGCKKFKHPCKNLRAERLEFSDLPSNIQDYIKGLTNEDISAVFILKISNDYRGKFRYSVRLSSGTNYHFNADGTMVKQVTKNLAFGAYTYELMPENAKTYIDQNIDKTMIIGYLRVTKMDNSFKYVVRLKDNTRYRFDAEGNFISKK